MKALIIELPHRTELDVREARAYPDYRSYDFFWLALDLSAPSCGRPYLKYKACNPEIVTDSTGKFSQFNVYQSSRIIRIYDEGAQGYKMKPGLQPTKRPVTELSLSVNHAGVYEPLKLRARWTEAAGWVITEPPTRTIREHSTSSIEISGCNPVDAYDVMARNAIRGYTYNDAVWEARWYVGFKDSGQSPEATASYMGVMQERFGREVWTLALREARKLGANACADACVTWSRK